MSSVKRVALVAHDNKKKALVDWIVENKARLGVCELITTGTTGKLIAEATGLSVTRVHSGPLGGDQQIGARISEQTVDLLIFFWDPLEPMSHDPDIKALLRIATLWNIPIACNQSSADFIISSPLMEQYKRNIPNFDAYTQRSIHVE